MKFKIGDKVKVVFDASGSNPELIGDTGTITNVFSFPNPFTGDFKGVAYSRDSDGNIFVAVVGELELVE